MSETNQTEKIDPWAEHIISQNRSITQLVQARHDPNEGDFIWLRECQHLDGDETNIVLTIAEALHLAETINRIVMAIADERLADQGIRLSFEALRRKGL